MFPFGHLVIAWLIALLIKKFSKIDISKLGWAMLFFGALLPDVDYLFDIFFNMNVHRMFTHSLLFVVFSFFVVYFILKQFDLENETFFFSLGVLAHLVGDLPFFPGILLFWPIGSWFSIFGIYNGPVMMFPRTVEFLMGQYYGLILDIVLGISWMSYLFVKGKINL